MSGTIDKSILELYSNGSKCSEYINDLSNIKLMSWDAVYWRVKYLYTYGRNICENNDLITYINGCFNQGLSINANQELYMDARKMQAELCILEGNFKMASNCILAVLDITEDVPPEMFLDLTCAEIHIDLLRILNNPTMFFNDLHMADGHNLLIGRQKQIIKTLLIKTAEAKSKDANISVDNARIEREVFAFGLMDSEEYKIYKKVFAGEPYVFINSVVEETRNKNIEEPTEALIKSREKDSNKRNKDGLLEIVIFPEEDDNKEDAETELITVTEKENKSIVKAKQPEHIDYEKPVDANANNQIDLKSIESMLSNIMLAVSENSKQIAAVQSKLKTTSDETEVKQIKADIERAETEKKELMEQLEKTKALLVKSEEEKSELVQTVENQNAILEEKKSAEFSESELLSFSNFERVIVFDTCSIENQLDLLDYIKPTEMVRVPKIVLGELENHKKSLYDTERQKMGQRAYRAIEKKKVTVAFDFDESYPFLLPDDLQINEEDDARGTVNDKKIFSVALRWKIYSKIPVLLLSDDVTVKVWAQAQHMDNMTATEFVSGRIKPEIVVEKPTKEEFLVKKIRCKEYGLSQYEVSVLQAVGIKTIGDFLNKTEVDLKFIKDKKGISYTARFTQVHKSIKRHFEQLFCE